jgi:hypothetical protein
MIKEINMKNWSPSDIIIVILASTISIVLLTIFIELAFTVEPVSDNVAKILGGLIGSIISIISMYIGAKIQKNKDN